MSEVKKNLKTSVADCCLILWDYSWWLFTCLSFFSSFVFVFLFVLFCSLWVIYSFLLYEAIKPKQLTVCCNVVLGQSKRKGGRRASLFKEICQVLAQRWWKSSRREKRWTKAWICWVTSQIRRTYQRFDVNVIHSKYPWFFEAFWFCWKAFGCDEALVRSWITVQSCI